MSIEQNKELARKWVEAFSHADAAAFDELVAPNFIDPLAPPGLPSTVEGVKLQNGAYHSAFPDIQFTVEHLVAADDMATVTWVAIGTNTGSLFGLPPTGKSATVHGANVFHIVDGRVTDHWVYFDRLGLLEQLGLVPQPG